MKKNMGSVDKVIRLILAAFFIFLFVFNMVGLFLGYILLVLALIFIITALVGWCPIYALLKIRTCKAK